MSRPKYKRPNKGRIAKVPDVNYDTLALKVSYEGSLKHKVRRLTDPLDVDPAKCPPAVTEKQATKWLRQAFRKGCVHHEAGKAFPSVAWAKVGELVYMARITNVGKGLYHGYPLWNNRQWPEKIDELWGDV